MRIKLTLPVFVCALLFCLTARAQMRQLYRDLDALNEVRDIRFFSPTTGYVAFANWIGYSTDSGRTFTKKYIGNINLNGYLNVNFTFGFHISGLKLIDQNTFLTFGDFGAENSILYSNDGGNSFVLVYHADLNINEVDNTISDLDMAPNKTLGFAVDQDYIMRTTNGGTSWSHIYFDQGRHFNHIQVIDNNNIFVSSSNFEKYILLKSTDGGVNWASVSLPAGHLVSTYFLDASNGYLNMNDGSFYKTTDGGANWTKVNAAAVQLEKMEFTDANTGFGISEGHFRVQKTIDGGKYWEDIPGDNNYPYNYNDLQALSSNQVWAGGQHGYLEMTSNGGGATIPGAYFAIDTSGILTAKTVKLLNLSKTSYTFQWFRNDTLISTSYNTSYSHEINSLVDTIKLVVSNGVYSDTAISYQYFPPPVVITSFSPSRAASGSTVTINGAQLSSTSAVSFGGTPAASFTVVSDNKINAVVGNGSSGAITIITQQAYSTSLPGFTFIPAPVITSFSPQSAKAGTVVTITGTNFDTATAVSFNGIHATSFTVVSPTTITATVPSGSSGLVSVTTAGGTSEKAGFIALPTMTSFLPKHGPQGTILRISGTSLTETSSITVGGIPVQSFNVNSSTSVTAIVANGASGFVALKTSGGADSLDGFAFIPTPVITSFTPVSGPVGITVTISGSNFNPVISNNVVYFGATKAIVTAGNSNSLTVTVPAGSTYQPISVTCNNLTAYAKQPFQQTFTGGTYFAPNSFIKHTFTTGIGAFYTGAFETADIDGDGKPDIVAMTYGQYPNSGVTVYRNTSSGSVVSFDTKIIDYENTDYLAIGDLNGDGRPDIVTNSRVYINTSTPGNTSFANPVILFSAPDVGRYYITDIDKDGKPDIIKGSGSGVYIYRNIGDEDSLAFDVNAYPIGGISITVNDIDLDGKPDIVSTDPSTGILSVAKNTSIQGKISFAPLITPAAHTPYMSVVGDLNGDGMPEIVSADNGGSALQVYQNTGSTGNITLGSTLQLPLNTTPIGVTLGDMDGDGKMDILVLENGYNFSLLRNTSSGGSLSFEPVVDIEPGSYAEYWGLRVVDFDGDGKPDVIANSKNNTELNIYINNTVPKPYIAKFTPTKGTAGTTVTISGKHLNGVNAVSFGGVAATSFIVISDSSITAVVSNGATGNVVVTNNYGSDTATGFIFGTAPVITSISPLSGPVGTTVTISGSGFDPVAGNNIVYFGGVKIPVLTATANTITVSAPPGAGQDWITVNGNGFTAYSAKQFAYTFTGDTSGFTQNSFAPAWNLSNQKVGGVSDLDGDGKLDLILLNCCSAFSVQRNLSSPGTFSFGSLLNFEPGVSSAASATGDFDGDGKIDVAVINSSTNTFSVMRNTSTGSNISFAAKVNYTVSPDFQASNSITVNDLDGDGRPDIVITNFNSHMVWVFKNLSGPGNIVFGPGINFATRGEPENAITYDLDGDGKPEIIASVYGVSFSLAEVYKNNSSNGVISFGTGIPIIQGGTSIRPTMSAAGDLDGDGKPDVTTAVYGSILIEIAQNASIPGTISFNSVNGPLGDNANSGLCVGDLDGDGKPDIVEFVSPSNINLLRNTGLPGSIALTPKFSYSTSSGYGPGFLADMDGDGVLDIINSQDFILQNKLGSSTPTKCVPVVTISQPDTTICLGGSISFTATISNGGDTPTYQWFVNGTSSGTNASVFTTSSITSTSLVKVVLTSNATCASPATDTSNVVRVSVNAPVIPAVAITSTPAIVCSGTSVTFTATATNPGTTPTYQWSKNGVNVGTNNTSYSDNTLHTGDTVNVLLTSNAVCATPTLVRSNTITMVISPTVTPSISISGNTVLDAGVTTTISAAINNGGNAPVYQWQDSTDTNGWQDIPGANSATIKYGSNVSGVKVRCRLTSNAPCVVGSTVTSNALTFIINSGGKIVPNPVGAVLNITGLKLSDQWVSLNIISLSTGAIVLTQNISNQTSVSIPVQQLAPGVYVVELISSTGNRTELKFIKS